MDEFSEVTSLLLMIASWSSKTKVAFKDFAYESTAAADIKSIATSVLNPVSQ